MVSALELVDVVLGAQFDVAWRRRVAGRRRGSVFTTIAVHVCVQICVITAVINIVSLCSMLWKKLLSELMDIYIQIPTRNRISYSSLLARTQLK